MCSSVEDWLRSLGLIHYTQAFLDNGYDELEICKEMGREDLDAIGVTNFKDRTDILNDVERLKQSGTAVYFVLEGSGTGNSAVQNVQPQRETYPPVKLKMLLHDKLEEDKINLAGPPYTRSDGSIGSVDALVTLYADKFFTYEKDVSTALLSLWQRQTRSNSVCENTFPQIVAPPVPPRTVPGNSSSSLVRHVHSKDEEQQDYKSKHGDASKDECPWMSVTKDEQSSPNRLLPDYLDVDSPGNHGGKMKKRRKVERNTKLSRSLDSLKELHVNNVEAKPRNRESSSFKGKSFPLKWFAGSKKKHLSHEHKKQVLEKKTSGHGNKDYHLLASAIKMSEEDRKTLMIMVKQGDLTVEEAVEQLKRYEEDCRPREDSVSKGDLSNDEERMGSKQKLKRGIFGKSSKRKSVNRPTSEFIACEMTMSEEDRINLMMSVKNGDMSVDQALKRFISYEEKHKKSDSDDSGVATKPSHYMKESPKIPKGSGFSRISIKRVSGVLSSSLRLSQNGNEPNSVFYTGVDDGGDGSVSSGDEVPGTVDSSPGPSPKRLLSSAQDSNKSQHSSTSSVESVDRLSEMADTSPSDKKPLTFLSEMKVTLASNNRGVELDGAKGKGINQGVASLPVKQELCGKGDDSHPSQSDRKRSLPCLESQKVSLAPNPTGSLKRMPPSVPPRNVLTGGVFPQRPPPPVPLRPKAGSTEEKSSGGEAGEREGKIHVENTPFTEETEAVTRSSERKKSNEVKTEQSYGRRNETESETRSPEIIKRTARQKPPPLPPRPPSSASSLSSLSDEIQITEARSVETQTSPPWAGYPGREGSLTTASSEEVLIGAQGPSPLAEHSAKPMIKPKPRPKPRTKMAASQDKEIDATYTSPGGGFPPQYHKLPPPRPVDEASASTRYHKVPSPRPVDIACRGDEHKGLRPASVEELLLDQTYDSVPTPRPLAGSHTRGESSGSSAEVNMDRDGVAPSPPQRPAPENRNRPEELEEGSRHQSLPVPAPRAKRASHSLGEMVERKLYIEKVDLTQEPYSDKSGCWRVPVNLVDRYAEELRRSHEELAGIMDKLRIRKLKQAGRIAIQCNVTELDFTRDPLGYLGSLDEWLISLGLPMYIDGLKEVEYDDMELMPYMEERHFQFAGIGDPRHMKRLIESVERMPR